MRHPSFFWLTLLTVVIGLGGFAGLFAHFQRERTRLERAQADGLQEGRLNQAAAERDRRSQWQDEIFRQQDQLQREVADRRAAQGRELELALGGPGQRSLKDPELPLAEMLRRVALACAPIGAQAVVRVDRFTEFDLVVSLRSLETPLVLAEAARGTLSSGARYLNSIRFTYDTNVLVELDRRQIESAEDWSRVTREQWLKLVSTPPPRRPSETRLSSPPATSSGAARASPSGAPLDWELALFASPPDLGGGPAPGETGRPAGPWVAYDQKLVERVNVDLQRLLDAERDRSTSESMGKITLKFRLHADGRVTDVEVVASELGATRNALYARAVLDSGPHPAWTDALRRAAGDSFRELTLTGSRRLALAPK